MLVLFRIVGSVWLDGLEKHRMVLKELEIQRNSGKPVSEQIASFVRSKIQKRELKAGTKLPTTLEMMEQFGVGSNTVRQAICALKEEGLVRPVPRLGTIVNGIETEASHINGFLKDHRDAVIAVGGLIQHSAETVRFRPETTQGIISECERLGASVFVLPESVLNGAPEALYNKLVSHECKGLVVVTPGLMADETIDYLLSRGIEVVTQRRFRHKDGRSCIESDYDGAGYDVGLYYYSCGCDKVLVFSHYELTCDYKEAMRKGYTLGLKHGIHRAYESKGVNSEIDFLVEKSEIDLQAMKAILAKLERVSSNTGIVFTNGYQLLSLFKNFPEQTKTLLGDKKITVVSNKTINQELEHYIAGIDLMALIDPYQEIGGKMVSLLLGILEGYLPRGATTLADIKFIPFHEAIN
jgi:DNA-binding transcriptional regulator YhcF (GntR family)